MMMIVIMMMMMDDDSGRIFSIWMTSFINIFAPGWCYRRLGSENRTEDDEIKEMKKISTINLPSNILIAGDEDSDE